MNQSYTPIMQNPLRVHQTQGVNVSTELNLSKKATEKIQKALDALDDLHDLPITLKDTPMIPVQMIGHIRTLEQQLRLMLPDQTSPAGAED